MLITVELPDDLMQALEEAAAELGETPGEYAAKLLEDYLDEMEARGEIPPAGEPAPESAPPA